MKTWNRHLILQLKARREGRFASQIRRYREKRLRWMLAMGEAMK